MRKYGKLPARPEAVSFKFASFFNAAELPTPPKLFGHFDVGVPWGTLANDMHSDCVFAGAAHETMVWSWEAGHPLTCFRDQDVLSDYAAVTGFDPANPLSDQGTDMADAASYRRKVGIVDADGQRHRVDSYVSLRPGNVDDLALSCYLTGAAGVGLRFPASADRQFDQQVPWVPVKGDRLVGGHYVPCVGRNSHGDFLVVTWGRLHAMTPAFYETYCDEALAYVSLEALGEKQLTPEGFNVQQLTQDLMQLRS